MPEVEKVGSRFFMNLRDNFNLGDDFKHPMQYDDDGGLGGAPVLFSPGKDGTLGNADDIRSDDE